MFITCNIRLHQSGKLHLSLQLNILDGDKNRSFNNNLLKRLIITK